MCTPILRTSFLFAHSMRVIKPFVSTEMPLDATKYSSIITYIQETAKQMGFTRSIQTSTTRFDPSNPRAYFCTGADFLPEKFGGRLVIHLPSTADIDTDPTVKFELAKQLLKLKTHSDLFKGVVQTIVGIAITVFFWHSLPIIGLFIGGLASTITGGFCATITNLQIEKSALTHLSLDERKQLLTHLKQKSETQEALIKGALDPFMKESSLTKLMLASNPDIIRFQRLKPLIDGMEA